MKLHLGCGPHYLEGWTNIDYSNEVRTDLNIDLDDKNLKFPYQDNEFDEAKAIDLVEHIQNIIPLMNEVWRVLKVGGEIYIETPLAGTVDFYKDPTHVRPFIPETFKYFAEWRPKFYGIKPWRIVASRSTFGGENQNRIFVRLQKCDSDQ